MTRIHLAIEGIVAATLATAACGDTTTSTYVLNGGDAGTGTNATAFGAYADQADFVCVDPLPSTLAELSPAVPVDFFEIRSQPITSDRDGGVTAAPNPDGGTEPSIYSRGATGTACAKASDPNACRASLAALRFDGTGGWTTPTYGANVLPEVEYAVYTRGNEVGKIASASELITFLGAIDTLADAQLVAYVSGRATLSCNEPTATSFEVPNPGWRRNADGG